MVTESEKLAAEFSFLLPLYPDELQQAAAAVLYDLPFDSEANRHINNVVAAQVSVLAPRHDLTQTEAVPRTTQPVTVTDPTGLIAEGVPIQFLMGRKPGNTATSGLSTAATPDTLDEITVEVQVPGPEPGGIVRMLGRFSVVAQSLNGNALSADLIDVTKVDAEGVQDKVHDIHIAHDRGVAAMFGMVHEGLGVLSAIAIHHAGSEFQD